MSTIAELKSAFYDLQRSEANIMDQLVNEIVELNKKLKEAAPKETKKED